MHTDNVYFAIVLCESFELWLLHRVTPASEEHGAKSWLGNISGRPNSTGNH